MTFKKNIVKHIWKYIVLFIALSIIVNLIMVAIAKNIETIIQYFEENNNSNFTACITNILILSLSYVVVNFTYYYIYYLCDIKARKKAVECVFEIYLNRDLNFFSKTGVGEINYEITHIASEVGSYYATFIPTLLVNFATLIILFITISKYSLSMSFGVILFIFFLIVITSFISKKIAQQTEKQEERSSKMHSFVSETINGISTVKLLSLERTFSKKIFLKSDYKYQAEISKNFWYSLYITIYDVMIILLPILTVVVGFILRNLELLTTGAVVSIYSIVGLLQEPIRNIADSITYYKENLDRVARLHLEQEAYCCNRDEEIEPQNIYLKVNEIEIEGNTILKDFELFIKKGEIIAIDGVTGSGKSTILKMLVGISEFKDYICMYNDLKMESNSFALIRKKVLLVEQNSFLFTCSILENICLGEKFDDTLLERVIEVCQLKSVIEKYGFKKEINFDSSNISGGEKQRICLARILIRRPSVLLLDEVTASLDFETSKLLAKEIVDFAKEYSMTIITVSHKQEFIEFCDCVIKV